MYHNAIQVNGTRQSIRSTALLDILPSFPAVPYLGPSVSKDALNAASIGDPLQRSHLVQGASLPFQEAAGSGWGHIPTSTLPLTCRRPRHPASHPVVAEAVRGGATGPGHPARPTSSPPTSSTGSARSCASPGAAAGAGQPQLAVMPRPCEAGALLCERSNRRGTADRMPFLLSPSAFGLSASVCRWQGRRKPYTKSKSRGEAC